MENVLHVYRSCGDDWIYKGTFNQDTQETSFGSIWADDRVSYDLISDSNQIPLLSSAAWILKDIFAHAKGS